MQDGAGKAKECRDENRAAMEAEDFACEALKQKVCEGYLNLANGWQKFADLSPEIVAPL